MADEIDIRCAAAQLIVHHGQRPATMAAIEAVACQRASDFVGMLAWLRVIVVICESQRRRPGASERWN